MLDFTKLQQAVTDIDTVKDSVVTLLTEIGQVLIDNAANQAEIEAMGQALIDDAATMAAAVLANTPPTP